MPIPDLSAHDNVGRTYQHILGTDIVGINSPALNKYDSGSFVAEATTCMLRIEVSGSQNDPRVCAGALMFSYGDSALVSPPLLPPTAGGTRTNVTNVNIGNIGSYPDTVGTQIKMTGLTVGHTYNWELGVGAVGYSDLLVLPDAPIAMGAGQATIAPGAVLGAVGQRTICVVSATKLHVIQQNHSGQVMDQILTGTGLPLTASRSTGSVAVSPNGLRCAVTNYALNTVSLYDLTNPALPVKIGADLATTASPWAVVWQDNDTFWMADLFVTAHVQKVTGASGASPAVQAAVTVDAGAGAMSITQLSITPDGTKLLLAGGTSKTYWINTSTNGVTSVAAPVTPSTLVAAIDNSTALVLYGSTPSIAILTFSGTSFATAVSSAAFANPLALLPFTDGRNAMLIESVVNTTRGNARQIVLPASGIVTVPAEYTNWAAVGTPSCGFVDEHGNIYIGTTNGNLSQWYGGVTNIRPSYLGFYGEKSIVQVTPAH